jgi:hypothetical protein
MGITRYALLLFAAAVITAAVAPCVPRRSVNELDARLLAFLRERDQLWSVPRAQGGIRESDVSNIVCPMVSLEGLREIVEVDSRALQYTPLTQVGDEWSHQFSLAETNGFMRTPTLVIWLSDDGSRCDVGFRMYGGI